MSDGPLLSITAVGVLGAGRAGTALARALARVPSLTPGAAAPGVQLASTAPPRRLRHHLTIYAPQAEAVSDDELAAEAELTVLAVPRDVLDEVDPTVLRGPRTRAVIDMTNAWNAPGMDVGGQPTTEEVSAWLSQGTDLPVVRAFFDVSHHELDSAGRSHAPRRALAVGSAPGDAAERAEVARLVRALGFDAVEFEPVAAGSAVEPGGVGFGAEHDVASLCRLLPRPAQQDSRDAAGHAPEG